MLALGSLLLRGIELAISHMGVEEQLNKDVGDKSTHCTPILIKFPPKVVVTLYVLNWFYQMKPNFPNSLQRDQGNRNRF